MKNLITAAVVLCLTSVTSMAQETIDGTSVETYERSAKAMVESIPEADRPAFAKGLINMILTRYPAAQGVEGFALLSLMPAAVEAAHVTMDGVTKEEIMNRAKEIAARDGSATTDPAPKDEAAAMATRECLQKQVIVKEATFGNAEYIGKVLEISLENKLPFAIGAVDLDYVVKSTGRTIPWDEDDMRGKIAGGIEPGESRTVAYGLYNTNAPEGAHVEVTITDAQDAAGRWAVAGGIKLNCE